MDLKDLSLLLKNTATEGTAKALSSVGVLPSVISKSEAYRLYGRGNVDRWFSEGLIACDSISTNKINKNKLARVAAASNRITYLPVAER